MFVLNVDNVVCNVAIESFTVGDHELVRRASHDIGRE